MISPELIPVQDCTHPDSALRYLGEQAFSLDDPSITRSLHRCRSCGTSLVRDQPIADAYEWEWAARHLAAQLITYCPAEELEIVRRSLLTLSERDVSLKLADYAVRDHAVHTNQAAA